MKRTTVYLEEAIDLELAQLARQQGRAKAELVREALETYVGQHGPQPLPRSVGVGRSGIPNLAEQDEAVLGHLYERKLARVMTPEEKPKDSEP